jgi:hypothetical protein
MIIAASDTAMVSKMRIVERLRKNIEQRFDPLGKVDKNRQISTAVPTLHRIPRNINNLTTRDLVLHSRTPFVSIVYRKMLYMSTVFLLAGYPLSSTCFGNLKFREE